MSLDLLNVLLALIRLCALLGDFELNLLSLEPLLRALFILLTTLEAYVVLCFRLLRGNLFNTAFACLDAKLGAR